MTTTATEAIQPTATKPATTIKPARQSRATRSATQASKPKPATKKTTTTKKAAPKPKPEPQAKGPSVTQQKAVVSQFAIDALATALKHPPAGVDPAQAAGWVGQWAQYFPSVRQGGIQWPAILGPVSMAGAGKAEDDESDDDE
jgi:hypothetical protein